MKIVIPGGAGFVGRNVVRVLANEGYNMKDVTVLDKDEKNLDYGEKYGAKTLLVDLSEKGDWYGEFNGKEIVVNLVAQISSPDYEPFYKNNVLTTENILEAAKMADIERIIHFGSAAVLSIRKDYYTQTKLEAEELVRKSGL